MPDWPPHRDPPNALPARIEIDPRLRALLMSFRQGLLMMASAIELYLGIQKQGF